MGFNFENHKEIVLKIQNENNKRSTDVFRKGSAQMFITLVEFVCLPT